MAGSGLNLSGPNGLYDAHCSNDSTIIAFEPYASGPAHKESAHLQHASTKNATTRNTTISSHNNSSLEVYCVASIT